MRFKLNEDPFGTKGLPFNLASRVSAAFLIEEPVIDFEHARPVAFIFPQNPSYIPVKNLARNLLGFFNGENPDACFGTGQGDNMGYHRLAEGVLFTAHKHTPDGHSTGTGIGAGAGAVLMTVQKDYLPLWEQRMDKDFQRFLYIMRNAKEIERRAESRFKAEGAVTITAPQNRPPIS